MAFRKFAREMKPDWVVYAAHIDVVFAVNTIIDTMALAILNRVSSYRTTKRRIPAGAVIDNIWSCVVNLVPGLPATVEILGMYVAVSSLMAVVAYHLKNPGEVVKPIAGTHLVSVVPGGVMLVLHKHTRAGYYAWLLVKSRHGRRIPVAGWILTTVGAATICYGFSGGINELIRTMAHRKDLCRVTMIYGEKKEAAIELIDMSNRLRGPMSNQPVHVVVAGIMKQLCPSVKGVVYVLHQSVGTGHGILPTVYINRMEIEQEGGRYSLEKPLIAIAKQELSPSGEYRILIQKSD